MRGSKKKISADSKESGRIPESPGCERILKFMKRIRKNTRENPTQFQEDQKNPRKYERIRPGFVKIQEIPDESGRI